MARPLPGSCGENVCVEEVKYSGKCSEKNEMSACLQDVAECMPRTGLTVYMNSLVRLVALTVAVVAAAVLAVVVVLAAEVVVGK